MSIAFVVLKLEGGQIDPPQGGTGSRNSQSGIGLRGFTVHASFSNDVHTASRIEEYNM